MVRGAPVRTAGRRRFVRRTEGGNPPSPRGVSRRPVQRRAVGRHGGTHSPASPCPPCPESWLNSDAAVGESQRDSGASQSDATMVAVDFSPREGREERVAERRLKGGGSDSFRRRSATRAVFGPAFRGLKSHGY